MFKTGTKLIVLLLLAAGILLAPPGGPETCLGQSAKKRMEKNRDERDKLYKKVKLLNERAGQLSDEIAGIENKIDSKESEISSIQKQLSLAEKENEALVEERKALELKLSDRQTALGQRMRAVYMQGDLGYLDLLFHAASFGDLIDRVYYIQAICEKDEHMISEHQENRVVLGVKISEIEATIVGINEMKERLVAQREQLGQLRTDKETVMSAIENDKKLFIRQAQELEQENKRIAASIRAKSTSASGYKGKPWSGSFIKPCKGEITSGFGYRVHPIFGVRKMHTGVDIGGAKGTAIHAAGDGKVIETGWGGGYGNMVIIDHGKGRSTLYGHMSRITCNTGDLVKAGDKVGEMGSTGYATGNHLHFEVRINGDPVNPLKAL